MYDWYAIKIHVFLKGIGQMAGRASLSFLEVGCFEGRATTWILENLLTHTTDYIDCIDTFSGSFEHHAMSIDLPSLESRFDHNVALTGSAHKVTKFKGRSGDRLRELRLASYDIAYIDGSHYARDVLEDAVLCHGLVKPGGFLIFDDYNWDQLQGHPQHPRVAIDAYLAIYRDELAVRHVGYQVIVQRG